MGEQELKTREYPYPQLMLEGQVCFPLYAAARRVVNAYTPLLKPLGLTYTQYIVCLAMWEMGKATVGDLCRKLYLDCGTLTPLLKKMEESGWVTRCRCKQDERVVYVSVTDSGWALREQVKDIPEQMASCVSMSREDSFQLYTLLYRLLDSMGQDG
jgi:DNA-binding MarR family transcriptional regulator